MPQSIVPVGGMNVIRRIAGRDDVRRHLAAMGFVVGEEVMVVNQFSGSLILPIKNSRGTLDQTLATHIME